MLMLGAIKSIGQSDSAIATVHYSFTHIIDTTQPDNPLTMKMVLYIGQNMSRYTIERTPPPATTPGAPSVAISDIQMGKLSAVSVGPGGISVTSGGVTMPVNLGKEFAYNNSYMKDISAGKLSFLTMPSITGKMFSVEEPIPTIDWTITTDIKEIGGMTCQKATARFRGRNYEAWFCSQLPYSNGPWKLGGLPGLILEAYDTKKEVMFKMTSFENGGTVALDIPSSVIKTTPKEYKQYQEAMQRDREAGRANSMSAGASGVGVTRMTVEGRLISPGGQPMKMRSNNNPIEKE